MNYPDKKRYEKCLKDIGVLLQKTSGIFQTLEREHVKKTGYTPSQSFLLTNLLETREMSASHIAGLMNLEKSSVSRMVQILVREGLVNKETDREDKRSLKITLTPWGREIAQQIDVKRKDYFSSIISYLPRGHVREVMNSAEVLFQALEQALG